MTVVISNCKKNYEAQDQFNSKVSVRGYSKHKNKSSNIGNGNY